MRRALIMSTLGLSALAVSLSHAQSIDKKPALSTPVLSPAPVQKQLDPKLISNIKLVPTGLKGYVDMHTHPMSHLGFGRKAMHGAPDVNMIIPAGTRGCNKEARRATSMADALGDCNSTHGGWGTDNTCGDYLRAGIVSKALDTDFKYNVGFDRNLHGDHEHAGHPAFDAWPHQTSVLHQQMWWEWVKRAKEGGLRVMVALTVSSETLAQVLNGDGPYDDRTVADVQIDETIKFVGQHPDFMAIARSAADIRSIVGSGRLAVVLGMEVDKIGNFGKPGVKTDDAAVRAEVQRLYRKGVRYMFPIHLIDNAFGGAAVYDMLFNFANKNQNGYHYRVVTDRNIGYSANLVDGPLGADNALMMGVHGLLTGIGEIPAPCFNDAIKCSPLPGKVRCCGSFENILNILKPSPEFDVYRTIPGGHVNRLGLTRLGEAAIDEMMRLGMIVDVDHMSERALRSTVALAGRVPGGYPLVMGHNGLRGERGNERGAPRDVLTSILGSGGMLGLGTADTTPANLVANFNAVNALRIAGKEPPKGSIALGTDANGFEPLPQNGRTARDAADLERQSKAFYDRFLAESGLTTKQAKPDGTSWDYVVDGGVSHYGLMPEFMFDVKTRSSTAHDELMSSAEYFARMWEKAESQARAVTAMPKGGTYPVNLAPIAGLCPAKHSGGDGEYGGHGPTVSGAVTLGISTDGSTLEAKVSFAAKETQSDWSEVKGEWTLPVGEIAPAGLRYTNIGGTRTSSFNQTLNGGGRNEVFQGCDGDEHVIIPSSGPVARLVVVGDTGGGDISNDNDCHCDTRIVSIEFHGVEATLAPR